MKRCTCLTILLMMPLLAGAQEVVWSEIYEGGDLWGLTPTTDGCLLATGRFTPTYYGLLLKIDDDGTIVQENYNASGDMLFDAVESPGGDYFSVGYAALYSDSFNGWILKTSDQLANHWSRFYGGTNDWKLYSIRNTDDGHLIAGGVANEDYDDDIGDAWIVKFDEQGDTLWSRVYSMDRYSIMRVIEPVSGGGYMGVGWTLDEPGDSTRSLLVMRFDSQGDTTWTRVYDFTGSCWALECRPHPIEGIVATGGYNSFDPNLNQPWIAHFDETGDTASFRIIPQDSTATAVTLDHIRDDIWILGGVQVTSVNFYGWLAACQTSGDTIWTMHLPEGDYSFINQVVVEGDYIYGAGTVYDASFNADGWFFKLTSGLGIAPEEPVMMPAEISLTAYPNPFNPTTALSYRLQVAGCMTLAVYDVQGRKVADLVDGWREAGVHEVTFDGSNLPSGIYFYRLTAGEFTRVGKIVLMK